jgi:small conductance mechanosensitive channel
MDFDKEIDLILEKLQHWWVAVIKMLPNFLLALIVLGLFFLVARWIRKFSCRVVKRISKSESVGSLISIIIYMLIVVVGFTTALNIMNLEKTVASLLAGVGIIGLALGFAFQDLTSNFISGVFMTFKRPFEMGDKIDTNGFIGTVNHMQLRSTTLLTNTGLHVIIPNKDIFQKPIINYSRSSSRRVELEFAVANTTDLTYLEKLLKKAVQGTENVSDVKVYFTAIDDPKIKLTVSFAIDNRQAGSFMSTRHKAIVAIYKAFGDNKIIQISLPASPTPTREKEGVNEKIAQTK